MTSLVTGGAGFIGSNLVDALIERGDKVAVIDNKSAESNEQFYWNRNASNYTFDIDSGMAKDVFKYFTPDCVYHMAAEARIQPSINNPVSSLRSNVVGTANILKLAHEHGSRFIFSSTSAVYGLKNSIPFKEDMPRQCLNPYSIGKAAGEDLCHFYHKVHGLETVIFRYFNVYGNRQPLKGQYAPVIGLFEQQKMKNEPLTVIGDGLQTRDFTHVSDVVGANMLAGTTQNKKVFGEVFNVGTGNTISILDLAKLYDHPHDLVPARNAELEHARADNSKIKTMLDWEPKVKLQEWVKR